MSVGRAGFAFAAGRNGKLYAVGGRDLTHVGSNLTEEYDPVANVWRVRHPTNTLRLLLGLAASASGRLFAVGGATGAGAADGGSVEIFAP